MKILSVLLEITPNPATRATRTPLSSLKGTIWFLYDPTLSASNCLERLPAGSILTWEDLTTRFLAQFIPPGRTAKLLVPMTLSTAWKILSKLLSNMHPRVPTKREASGLMSNFMASQDAKLSKFEADFKQQQSEMTNKIDIVLKAITDRITGALPSDTVKNPKLNVNSTSPVLSAHGTKSYPVGIVRDVEVHIGRLKLLNDFYVIDMKKDPETPLLVGRGFLATANAVIDCRKAKKAVGEGITRSIFCVKRN
ncbi:MAK10-like protein [Tanacetum coccineum]